MKTSKVNPVRLCLLLILSGWIATFGLGYIFMKEIPISRGMIALVDDDDFESLSKFKWNAMKGRHTYYATRNNVQNGVNRGAFMHRVIMNVSDNRIHVDHKDHNGLNNQKSNLRICTNAQNRFNMIHRSGGTSRYRGVDYSKRFKCWRARINKAKEAFHLGWFKSEKEAALAYNNKAVELYGEFANLNVIS